MSDAQRSKHKDQYNEEEILAKRDAFERKRNSKIEKRKLRIETNTVLIQNIDPLYLDYNIIKIKLKRTVYIRKITIKAIKRNNSFFDILAKQ